MNDPATEKRAHARVQTRLTARARVIREGEAPLFRQTPGAASHMEEAVKAGLSEAVASFMEELDRKMDTILGLLGAEELQRRFPLELEVVELSGAGMRFAAAPELEPGSMLEVVVTLSTHPYRLAGTMGKVVGTDEDSNTRRFEFTSTRQTDLEEIIRFVFQEQREQIRSSKKMG